MKTKFYLSLIGLWLGSNLYVNAQTVTVNDSDFKTYLLSRVDIGGGGNEDGEIQTSEALNLTQLFYQNESLTDPTGLEAFTNLTELYLNNTVLGSTIDLSDLTKMETLDVTNTGISSLDVSALSALVSLSIGNNASLQSLDVSNLGLLRILQANNSGLTALDLSNNSAIEQLRVIGNDLVSLNLRNGANATFTTMRATNNGQLECIAVDDPAVSAGYADWVIDASASYAVTCEPLVEFGDSGLEAYLTPIVDHPGNGGNNNGVIEIAEAEAFAGSINYNNKGLTDVTGLQNFISVVSLNLSGNSFSNLDLSDLVSLITLNLSNCGLASLTLPDAPIENLYLSNNSFENLVVSGYSTLEQLWANGNNLETLNASNNPAMTRLSINANSFVNWSDIDISGSTAVTLLEVQANPLLESIDVSSLSGLTQLYAGATAISGIDLSTNTQLTTVNLATTTLGSLNHINLKNGNNHLLTTFNASNNANLDCILVDNVDESTGYAGWQKPATARYTLGCGPLLVSTYPSDGTTDFPILSEIRLTFSEPIQIAESLTTGAFRIQPGSSIYYDMSNENTLEVKDGNTLIVRPFLLNNTPRIDHEGDYYMTMASGVVLDLDGNEFPGWSDAETYNFTTESEAESIAQYEAFGPAHNEIGVSTLLEEMTIEIDDLSAVNGGTLRLFEGSSTLIKEWDLSMAEDFEIDGDLLKLFNLPELAANKLHWVQLIGHRRTWGYTYGSLVKSTGEHLQTWANDRIWQFTTGSGPTVTVNDAGLEGYLRGLVDTNNGGNSDGKIQVSEAESFTGSISYFNKGLTDPTGIGAFVNVTYVALHGNNISSIDLGNLNDLTTLVLSDNEGLQDLNLGENTVMRSLYLQNVDLESIDLSGFITLTDFRIGSPEITEIDLSENILLENLFLVDCPQLNSLTFTSLSHVEQLGIDNINVSSIDFTGFTSLNVFNLEDTPIEVIDISKCGELDEVLVASNAELRTLKVDNGANEAISDFEVSGSPNLTCIQVNDVAYANSNWSIEEGMAFSSDCRSEQVITFTELTDMTFGDGPFELSASSDSGLDVTFSIVSGPISLSENMVSITGAGLAVIAANQAGSIEYTAAEEVTRTFEIRKADQIITVKDIEDKHATDDAFEIVATVDSGLDLDYSIEGPASIDGESVILNGEAGTVIVTVSQEGNENYNSASKNVSFDVLEVLSVDNQTLEFQIYPNPVTTWLRIKGWSDLKSKIQIINIQGKVMLEMALTQNIISTHDLQDGVYVVRLISNNNSATTTLLIQR